MNDENFMSDEKICRDIAKEEASTLLEKNGIAPEDYKENQKLMIYLRRLYDRRDENDENLIFIKA